MAYRQEEGIHANVHLPPRPEEQDQGRLREIEDEPSLIDRLLFTMFFVHTGQDRQCFSKQLSHLNQKVIKLICITF